jgi:hypothetical protein
VNVLWALLYGLAFWIAAWALGIKAFDAFLVTLLLVSVALAWRVTKPFVQSFLSRAS